MLQVSLSNGNNHIAKDSETEGYVATHNPDGDNSLYVS